MLGYIITFFLGSLTGMFIMALCVASSRNE